MTSCEFTISQFWSLDIRNKGISRTGSFCELCEENLCTASPASGGCWRSLAFLDLWKHHPSLCLYCHMVFSLIAGQISSFYKDTRKLHWGISHTVWPHLNSNYYIYKNPVSKYSHILSFWRLGHHYMNLGGHKSTHNTWKALKSKDVLCSFRTSRDDVSFAINFLNSYGSAILWLVHGFVPRNNHSKPRRWYEEFLLSQILWAVGMLCLQSLRREELRIQF